MKLIGKLLISFADLVPREAACAAPFSSRTSSSRPRHLRWPSLFGVLLLVVGLAAVLAPAASAQANLLTNGSFATGSTSGWTCSADDTVVASPTYDGASDALAGTPTGSDDAQCSQVVSVQPSSSYTLTGWVEGDYVFLGDSGTGTSDTDNWTPSATTWTELSTSFTTGSSTTQRHHLHPRLVRAAGVLRR